MVYRKFKDSVLSSKTNKISSRIKWIKKAHHAISDRDYEIGNTEFKNDIAKAITFMVKNMKTNFSKGSFVVIL